MIVHLLSPDPKFPPLIRRLWLEAADEKQLFIFVNSSEERQGFSSVASVERMKLLLAKNSESEDITTVMLHGVLAGAHLFLPLFGKNVKIIWFIWGREFYSPKLFGCFPLLGPKTERLYKSNFLKKLRWNLMPTLWKLSGKRAEICRVMERIDVVVSQLPHEYEMICQRGYLKAECAYCQAPVLSIEDVLDTSAQSLNADANNIQLGNSAHPEGNHIEAMEILADQDLGERKVIVPLSYGKPEYRDIILSVGRQLLGDKFQPLTEFMPLDAYNEIVGQCGVVVMNQYRQQGLGNIMASLWRGDVVFLASEVVYNSYREFGLSVEWFRADFKLADIEISTAARQERMKINRQIITQKLSRKVVLVKYASLLYE